jgi:hypothetical protein
MANLGVRLILCLMMWPAILADRANGKRMIFYWFDAINRGDSVETVVRLVEYPSCTSPGMKPGSRKVAGDMPTLWLMLLQPDTDNIAARLNVAKQTRFHLKRIAAM